MSSLHKQRPSQDQTDANLTDADQDVETTDTAQHRNARAAIQLRAAGPLPQPSVAGHGAPTAGPSEDDRFGEGPVASDAHGRILGVSIVGGRTRIMIGLGQKQGIHLGMEGYIKAGDGMLADFQVEDVKERICSGFVDVTPDGLSGHQEVVVNPTSRPKSAEPQKDMAARIVGLSIEGGQTKIMIGRGANHGARAGMRGYIIGSGGRPFATFEIAEQYATHTVAFVHHTEDELREHSQVMLNPSSMP